MNFDLDDPLGDILSDGSNDSFFESGKKAVSKPRPTKANVPLKDTDKKKADLFGIKNPEESKTSLTTKPNPFDISSTVKIPPKSAGPSSITTINQRDDVPRKPESPKPISAKTSIQPKKDNPFGDDDDDIDLGFDLKKIKSKTGIFDDLLGLEPTVPKPNTTSQPKPTSTLKIVKKENPAPTLSKPVPPVTQQEIGTYAPSAGRTRVGRRSSTTLPDPLGLFSSDQPEKKKPDPKQSDWLGLESVAQKETFQSPTEQQFAIETAAPIITHEQPPPVQQSHQFIQQQIMPVSKGMLAMPATLSQFTTDSMQSAQMVNLLNKESETALQEMRQQEFQMMYATQIKNQENALYEMQKRQHDLISQQELQFNELIRNQLNRQELLESNIKQQQQRINSHIQILLAQPPPTNYDPAFKNVSNAQNSGRETDETKIQADHSQIDMEKLRLEDMISNVNASHEQEIALLEQSYKNQIRFLTESSQDIEARLKDDNNNLKEMYGQKLTNLEEESKTLKTEFETKIRDIEDEHDRVVKKIKATHQLEMEELRKEQKNMIEHIRESKILEFSIVQENGSYLQTLKSASKYLENATGDLEALRGNITDKMDEMYSERQMKLEISEKAVEAQQKRLEKSQELADEEKKRLLELVKTLEIKLNAVKQTAAEEDWSFKQKIISLESDKVAFERERAFYREQQEREQKNLDDMRNIQVADYDRKLRQIENEKTEMLVEKSKLETLSRVQSQQTVETSRVEIETSIKIAQDAARQADEERERLFQAQRRLETKNRELIDKEQSLRDKESNLDATIYSVKSKERHARHMLKSAQLAEQKFQTKLQLLQKHSNDIAVRESNISKEKLELSRQRLELDAMRKKLFANRCSLCKIGEKSAELSNILTRTHVVNPMLDDESHRQDQYQEFNINGLERMLDNEADESLQRMESNMKSYEVNIDQLPNITEIDDQYLDPQLLMLKLDALHNTGHFA